MGFEIAAAASLAATVIGGAVSAMGAIQQGNAAANTARYQAESAAAAAEAQRYQMQVANNNAISAQQNAAYERARAANEAEIQDTKSRATMGAQLAGMAASGFDVNTGSAIDIRESTKKLSRLDNLSVRQAGELSAREFDQQARNDKASAALYGAGAQNSMREAAFRRSSASDARTAGYLGAFSSLLGTASSVGSKWNTFKTAGLGGRSGTGGLY